MSKQNTLDAYIEAAKKHGEATESGDYRKANRQYDRLVILYKEMLKANDHSFESLLSYSDSSVRGWAAVHSLSFIPEKARSVLTEIAGRKGLVALMLKLPYRSMIKEVSKLMAIISIQTNRS